MLTAKVGATGLAVWQIVALGIVVIVAAVVDLRVGKAPNWVTYPAVIFALAAHSMEGGLAGDADSLGLTGSLVGLAAGFVPLLVCWRMGGMGGGDAKLMGAIGALGGWQFAIAAMLYSFLAAAVMALVVVLRRKMLGRTLRRIAAAAVMLITPGGRAMDAAGDDSPKVPFAVAICVGTIAAAAMRQFLAAG